MSGMNLTTTNDISKSIPNHWNRFSKKGKTIILPDGTEIPQEEFEKMDERHWWEKKKTVLGQGKK